MTLARLSSRFIAVALAALLATMFWPASAARGADDTNIPGVPLPGSVVTGVLGGPVYDHVYAIDVPADRVILIALNGDTGTDFDLYLFDASATTIYDTVGQVATSTGPTSTESITYPAPGGGRFYIDLNGASAVEGNFRLTVKVAADTAAPNAQIHINDDALATSDATVRVTLVATDDVSGVTSMQFAVDGGAWDSWRPYVPVTLWSFPQVDGPRQFAARVRDRAGNVSTITTATIWIDTVNPAVTSISPEPGETSLRPTFRVVFSEPIVPSSWSSLGFLLQAADGSTVPGTYRYDDAARAGLFTPAADLLAGGVYVATLGRVTDPAGNAVADIGSWVVRPLRSHVLTLAADTKTVTYGTVVTLHGHIDAPVGGPLNVERSVAGAPWQVLATAAPDASGNMTVLTTASANARYRLHLAAGTADTDQLSPAVALSVRQRVALRSVPSTVTRRVVTGSLVSVRAVVTPSRAPAITMSIYRFDAARRANVLAGTVRRGTVAGVAAFAWRPSQPGSYYLRFTAPSLFDLAAGTSAAYRWVVG
jgi:hypothetical protein